jgi:hypothetical protein
MASGRRNLLMLSNLPSLKERRVKVMKQLGNCFLTNNLIKIQKKPKEYYVREEYLCSLTHGPILYLKT